MSHVHLTSFPEYKQAAKILADKGAEVRLAMVNAMEEMELAKRFEIRGFPTLKYFKHGVIPRDYQGHRKAEASRAAHWPRKRVHATWHVPFCPSLQRQ